MGTTLPLSFSYDNSCKKFHNLNHINLVSETVHCWKYSCRLQCKKQYYI